MALILTCYNHPENPATATCDECGEPICAACTHKFRGQTLCPADYAIARRDGEGEVARAPRRSPPAPPQAVTRRPPAELRPRQPAPLEPTRPRPLQPRRAADYELSDPLAGFQYDPRRVAYGKVSSNAVLILAISGLGLALLSLGGIFVFSGLGFIARLVTVLAAIPALIISSAAWLNRYEARDPAMVLLLSVLGAAISGVITLLLLLAFCLPFMGLKLLLPFFLLWLFGVIIYSYLPAT